MICAVRFIIVCEWRTRLLYLIISFWWVLYKMHVLKTRYTLHPSLQSWWVASHEKYNFISSCVSEWGISAHFPRWCLWSCLELSLLCQPVPFPNSSSTDLRFSMALCDEEKRFRQQRRDNIMHSIKSFLGEENSQNLTTSRDVSLESSQQD